MDCFVCYLVFTGVTNGLISNWYIEIKKKVSKKVIENFCDYIKNTTFATANKDGSVAQLDRATPF